jgi:plasmid replication initiation protein
LAGFTVAYRPIKRGRRITGIELAWGKKQQAELIQAQRELDRSRVGRTSRRDGVVETIAQERYRLAESLAQAGLDRPVSRINEPP